MKPTFFTTLLCLAFSTPLSLAQENSQLFSQFAGAPTVTANFNGSSATLLSSLFTICTNAIHALQPVNVAATSAVPQLEQEQVDGVCEVCVSVEISRIDSCCAQPTSVACFEQFAAQTTSTTSVATSIANFITTGATPTATVPASTPSSTKTSNGNRFDAVGSERSFCAVLDANGF